MRITSKCKGCGEEFRKDEMIQYFSSSGKSSAWYCQTCYEEKLAREKFSKKVCQIFQLKSPGPRIWTERQRLQKKYGYTDDTIVDCLEYIYEVKKMDKLTESLALINPRSMIEMKKWKAERKALGGRFLAAAAEQEVQEKIITMPEPKSVKKEINLDDGLFDD